MRKSFNFHTRNNIELGAKDKRMEKLATSFNTHSTIFCKQHSRTHSPCRKGIKLAPGRWTRTEQTLDSHFALKCEKNRLKIEYQRHSYCLVTF